MVPLTIATEEHIDESFQKLCDQQSEIECGGNCGLKPGLTTGVTTG